MYFKTVNNLTDKTRQRELVNDGVRNITMSRILLGPGAARLTCCFMFLAKSNNLCCHPVAKVGYCPIQII